MLLAFFVSHRCSSDTNCDITVTCSYPLGINVSYACCIAGNTTCRDTLSCMRAAELLSSLPQQPTIFFKDSDEQLLLWLQHARTMRNIEGRWQGAWSMFAAAAESECKRRRLTD